MNVRMRKHWRDHSRKKDAIAVIGPLFKRPWDREGDGEAHGVFEHRGMLKFQLAAGSEKEKQAAMVRALALWNDTYKERASRGVVPLDDTSPAIHAAIASEDFRDAIEL